MPAPIPFTDNDAEEVFWKPEPWDKNLPSPGLITDFVMALRGVECPTQFCIWNAIWMISSALKRETWLNWHPFMLYPNVYVIIVSPPRICAKSTGADYADRILKDFAQYIPHEKYRLLKQVNRLLTKATPEALDLALLPQSAVYINGSIVEQIELGSQLAIYVSELSTFLGKQKYNTGLVDRLTHLYDSKSDDESLTIARGKSEFKNLYVTLLGATTPDGLDYSIPQEAFGGGFMSRVILVFQDTNARMFPRPRPVLGGPTVEDLQRRLAWVSMNAMGEYTFSDEANEYYENWYPSNRMQLEKELDEKKRQMRHRFDNHLFKISLIVRASRYETGRVVGLQDLVEAKRILDATYKRSYTPVANVGMGQNTKWQNRVREFLMKKESATRKQVLQAMSPYNCRTGDVTQLISYLFQQGDIEIFLNEKHTENITNTGKEIYKWVGVKYGTV